MSSSQKRRNMRIRLMSNNGGSLMRRLASLETYQKKRVNTGRNLSENNKHWEKYQLNIIRNLFREAGASRALPFRRLKVIAKLRNVYPNALAIVRARSQSNKNKNRTPIRPENVSSLKFGKRLNGRGPNVLVLSPR